MKSSCTSVLCIGIILILGGGFLVIYQTNSLLYIMGGGATFYDDDPVPFFMYYAAFVAIFFIGVVMVFTQLRSIKKWNAVVGIAKSQGSITMKEMSVKSGVPEDKVGTILYEAISSGDLSGTIEGNTFSRSTPSVSRASDAPKVLVICPYCGAKTEQGLSSCQKCGASL